MKLSSRIRFLTLVVACVFVVGCSDDSPVDVGDSGDGYLPPSSPENVMANFVRAYNTMNYDRYEPLLDENFRFRFAVNAESYPHEWSRKDELIATRHMFGGEDSGDSRYGKILDIDVVLTFDEDSWEVVPPPLSSHEGEEWRRVTLDYSYVVTVVPDISFVSETSMTAEFILKKSKKDEWHIERWDDTAFGCEGRLLLGTATICEWNWGQIKALYLFED